MTPPSMSDIQYRLRSLHDQGTLNSKYNDAIYAAFQLIAELRLIHDYNPKETLISDLITTLHRERSK